MCLRLRNFDLILNFLKNFLNFSLKTILKIKIEEKSSEQNTKRNGRKNTQKRGKPARARRKDRGVASSNYTLACFSTAKAESLSKARANLPGDSCLK